MRPAENEMALNLEREGEEKGEIFELSLAIQIH